MSEVKNQESRDKGIIKVSLIGIGANVALALLKLIIGLLSNSIAIILDAINNTADAASSTITIVGTKLAAKPADKKHPFGYGRIEYFSAMIISFIILYAGITSLVESIQKIIHPEPSDYAPVSLIFLAIGVVVKILLGKFTKKKGKEYNSSSLVNSGEDATLDSIISSSTLVAAGIFIIFGLSLEAWLGAIISLIIIKSGVEMVKETVSALLGESYDMEEAIAIKNTIKSFEGVYGAFDLVLNNYGPDSFSGSVHIEVPDTYTATQIDDLVRKVQMKVFDEHNVILNAIGIYSRNTVHPEATKMLEELTSIVEKHEHVKNIHGFYLSEELKMIRFDLVVSFDSKDRRKTFDETVDEIKAAYPDYKVYASMDADFNELVTK